MATILAERRNARGLLTYIVFEFNGEVWAVGNIDVPSSISTWLISAA